MWNYLGHFQIVKALPTYLANAIKDDYLATGQCNFQLGKDVYMTTDLPWGLAKGAPYREDINYGYS